MDLANVYGRKLNATDNQPVEGWPIFLDIDNNSTPDYMTLTDRNGEYAFRGIPVLAATWTLGEGSASGWSHENDVVLTPSPSTPLLYHDFVNTHYVRLERMESGNPVVSPVPEGQIVSFTAFADAGSLIETPTYTWNISGASHDTFSSSGNMASFRPTNDGRITVEVTVTGFQNPQGGAAVSHTTRYELFVNNVLPANVSAGGPYTIAEGDSLALTGSATDVDSLTYAWDLDNDGDFEDATGASPTLTWTQLTSLGFADGPGRQRWDYNIVRGGDYDQQRRAGRKRRRSVCDLRGEFSGDHCRRLHGPRRSRRTVDLHLGHR
jgi:hypothetical protein